LLASTLHISFWCPIDIDLSLKACHYSSRPYLARKYYACHSQVIYNIKSLSLKTLSFERRNFRTVITAGLL
jgi:hypothetical protein